jgi:hypothetical protein
MNPGTTLGARFHGVIDQATFVAFLITAGAGLAVAWVGVADPGAYRLALAALLTINLLVISARWPRAAAIGTLAGLPFLALIRRLLIHDAGWTSTDPLLLVAPVIAGALVYRLFAVERRPLAPDRLSKLVLALLALTLLQTLNPTGTGLGVNVVGLLFAAAPLMWFFVGRELTDERMVVRFGVWMIVSGSLIALYGLQQTNIGLPSWDQQWVSAVHGAGGYASLQVGEVSRAFGTFSSATEYAQYLGVALMAALAFAFHRRLWAALALPLLAAALFLASNRTTLVLALVAIVVVVSFRFIRRPAWATTAAVLIALVIAGTFQFVAPRLQQEARTSQSDLVQHQLGGVADPLNSNQSTLTLHARKVRDGVVRGFHQPLGQGTGITSLAGYSESNSYTTEIDVSNAFVSLGLVGGVLYLVVIGTAFSETARLYWQQRAIAPLLVLSALIVSLGQWLNGGHYAVSAIIWFLLGWVASERARALAAEAAPASPSRTAAG